jgi:hypothetical protein
MAYKFGSVLQHRLIGGSLEARYHPGFAAGQGRYQHDGPRFEAWMSAEAKLLGSAAHRLLHLIGDVVSLQLEGGLWIHFVESAQLRLVVVGNCVCLPAGVTPY